MSLKNNDSNSPGNEAWRQYQIKGGRKNTNNQQQQQYQHQYQQQQQTQYQTPNYFGGRGSGRDGGGRGGRSGRAGRGNEKGLVHIQTKEPQRQIFKHILNYDYITFFEEEIKISKVFGTIL